MSLTSNSCGDIIFYTISIINNYLMKNKTILLIILGLTLNVKLAFCQNINIPDENFKNALLKNTEINTNDDGEIQLSEALAFTGKLEISNKNIISLVGIEYFKNLTNLNCAENDITDLDVSKNTLLTWLNCQENNIQELNLLSNTNLDTLDCYYNNLNELDLSKNSKLKLLNCGKNNLNKLDISQNIALEKLYCMQNQIQNLDISQNTRIYYLYCYDNQLKQLNTGGNNQLSLLRCSENQLTELNITNNNNLHYLDCKNNNIIELDISKNYNLRHLNCRNNRIEELDISKNSSLQSLSCANNFLSKLNVKNKKFTTAFSCRNNCFSFSQLNEIKNNLNFSPFSYSSNKIIFKPVNIFTGQNIDYSLEQNFDNNPTTFTWYNSDYEIVNEEYVKTTKQKGVFQFLKAGTYYCKMTNNYFPDLELKTAPILVQEDKIIDIPDENFKRELVQSYDKNSDKEISISEALSCEWLSVGNKNIKSLKGIEYFENITFLNCQNNKITSLDLSKNTKLENLKCFRNNISSLDLSNNTKLELFDCQQNNISKLTIGNNQVLRGIDCQHNSLENLDISNNKNLTGITCSYNKLENIDFSKNTELNQIDCSDNKIQQLDLTSNTKLKNLNCSHNQLENIDISQNSNIVYLNCSYNNLSKVNLENVLHLRNLLCHHNKLSNIDIQINTNLIWLKCDYNKLTNINLTKNEQIQSLTCTNNLFSAIDISKNTSLLSFSCSNNKIAELNINNQPSLIRFDCDNNFLSKIDISNNKKLKWFNGSNNNFREINLKKNELLTNLYLSNNNLSSLDLSSNNKLSYLKCDNNFFTFTELKKIKDQFVKLKYVSDKRIFTAQTHKTGEIIDYSSEKEFDKQATTYQWYQSNNADANESIKETDQAGIFSLVHPGEYYCQLSNPYFPNTVLKTQNITVTGKKTQNINHNIPSSVKVNDITNIIAFSNSDLNVDFEILEGNAVINNKQLTCKQEGSVKIRLFQNGNAEYNASELVVSIVVDKKTQTIQINDLTTKVKVNDVITLNAIASSNLPTTYEIIEGIAEMQNNTITFQQAGTVKIKVLQVGNREYEPVEIIIEFTAEIVTGIDALNNKSVTIYPNPTPNELHFKFNDSKKRTIYFYNLEGQLLTQHNCNNSFETFTIANLPNGMIIVKVLEENEIKYYKIIKI